MEKRTGFFELCWDNLLQLILLNLCFFLCSILVVTLPSAFTALCAAAQRMESQLSHPIKSFFACFRRELFSALPLGILFIALPCGLLYGCYFYMQAAAGMFTLVLSLFCLICAYLLFCAGQLAFHIEAAVCLRTRDVLQDTGILLAQHPRLFFTWLAAAVLVPAACILLLPYSLPISILLCFSLSALCSARGVRLLIETEIIKEE